MSADAAAAARLLPPVLLERLGRLRLAARRRLGGRAPGERVSPRRGHSMEFAEHRAYAAGDDLRYLDWSLLARLDRPYLKTYHEEEDVPVSLIVDTSASMAFGTPSKLDAAVRMAAALGWLALTALDRVRVRAIATGGVAGAPSGLTSRPVRGRPGAVALAGFLARLQADGGTALASGLRGVARSGGRAGITVVISDFLDPAGAEAGLASLAARGEQLHVVHVLSPEECEPQLAGDLELVDAETGDRREISASPALLARYGRMVADFRAHLAAFCRRRGAGYIALRSDRPVDDALVAELRQSGVVG